jgi:hypothetical protein
VNNPIAIKAMTQIFQSFKACPTYFIWNSLDRELQSTESLRSTSMRSDGVRNFDLQNNCLV